MSNKRKPARRKRRAQRSGAATGGRRPLAGKAADKATDKAAGAPVRPTAPFSTPEAVAGVTGPATPRPDVTRFAVRTVGSESWRARVEDSVVTHVNEARRKAKLSALRGDERLRRSARAHSADMAARDYFDHENPDGTTPAARMLAAGYQRPALENIARGQRRAEAVMYDWMNSPGHRRNILNPDVRTIGVGVHLGDGGPWWTQHFGY